MSYITYKYEGEKDENDCIHPPPPPSMIKIFRAEKRTISFDIFECKVP